MKQPCYRGRFAPSPTGPLHFGSLITALGSYLDAKAQGGEWWLRIDDLDPPRVAQGATDAILRALEAYGLTWDGAVQYQRQRSEAYAAALAELQRLGLVYACACSRREIADSSIGRPGAPVYPGTCRAGLAPGKAACALRVDTRCASVVFEDRLQGTVMQDLEREAGDFIVQRADGLFAYQLAAVVDDAELGITDIVRGADLLDSTLRQVYLQRLLGLPLPRYLHLPVAVNALGEKLSKQTLAPPLDIAHPQPALVQALSFLNHSPPQALQGAKPQEILAWAVQSWSITQIPQVRSVEPQI
ncbi:MAG: tRNA glutamyl-Q(34) synthetase GluQRS [Pseudomonadota bacterium]